MYDILKGTCQMYEIQQKNIRDVRDAAKGHTRCTRSQGQARDLHHIETWIWSTCMVLDCLGRLFRATVSHFRLSWWQSRDFPNVMPPRASHARSLKQLFDPLAILPWGPGFALSFGMTASARFRERSDTFQMKRITLTPLLKCTGPFLHPLQIFGIRSEASWGRPTPFWGRSGAS